MRLKFAAAVAHVSFSLRGWGMIALVACGCSASGTTPGLTTGDVNADDGGVAAAPDAAAPGADSGAPETDAGAPAIDAAPDVLVDKWFDQPCFPNRPSGQDGCNGGTFCESGYTASASTGFDSGIELHAHCTFGCPGGDISQCRDQSDSDAGVAPPGAYCVHVNNGQGGVGFGACAPPPGYVPPHI